MKAMKGLLTNFVCPPAQKWINDKLLKKNIKFDSKYFFKFFEAVWIEVSLAPTISVP